MTIIRMLLVVVLFSACGQQQNDKEENLTQKQPDTSRMEIMIPQSTCYVSTAGRDTIKMKVEKFPNTVIGTLIYSLYEKDGNRGDLEGKISGDTLIAEYTFMSEGRKSIRQVIFLLKEDSAIEGFGPVNEDNGKMVFKDRAQIKFNGPVLQKTDCRD